MKLKAAFWLLLFASIPAIATTTVSSTGVVDTDGFTWKSGTYLITVSTSGSLPYAPQFSGTLDATTGGFTQALPDLVPAIAPAGSKWKFHICPNATSGCFDVLTTVSGTTQDITSLLNASASGPRFAVASSTYGYGTVELTGTPTVGWLFANTTNSTAYSWNGSAWVTAGGGSAIWGGITGTLSSQTDLQTALNAKQSTLTGCTSDSANGLVCTGQVQSSNMLGPPQPQTHYALTGTMTKIANMHPTTINGSAIPGYTPSQLRMVISGDSTANMHAAYLAYALAGQLGNAGTLSASGLSSTGTITPVTGDYTMTPTGTYSTYSAGACAIAGLSGGGIVSTDMAVLYVQEPGAGTITVSTLLSNGSGGWNTPIQLGSPVSAAGTLSGQVFTGTIAEALYELQVCVTGGPVKVYDVAMVDKAVNGVVVYQDNLPGLRIADYTKTPAIMTAAWDAFLAPDIVTSKWDTNGMATTYPVCLYTDTAATLNQPYTYYWPLWVARWYTTNPLRDIVIDGTYPLFNTNPNCDTVQNDVSRAWAQTAHKRYFDGYNELGASGNGVTNAVTLNWMTDGAHQTGVGQWAESEMFINDLGLNSLVSGYLYKPVAAPAVTATSIELRSTPGSAVASNNVDLLNFSITGSDANLQFNRHLFLKDSAGVTQGTLDAGSLINNIVSTKDFAVTSSTATAQALIKSTVAGGSGKALLVLDRVSSSANSEIQFKTNATSEWLCGTGQAGGEIFTCRDAVNSTNALVLNQGALTNAIQAVSYGMATAGTITATGFAGNTLVTLAAGVAAGTSPGTPACIGTHVCEQFSGQVGITVGTATTTGALLTLTQASGKFGPPNCVVKVNLTASPYTELDSLATSTQTVVTINVGTAPTASTAYTVSYVCGGR